MLENNVLQHIIIDPAGQLEPGQKDNEDEKGTEKGKREKENEKKKIVQKGQKEDETNYTKKEA